MNNKVKLSTYVIIGTMLFGMFFGAGNLIFPIQMGQLAGTNYWMALIGFLITAIGLPFLGIISIGLTGSNGLRDLGNRVHPWFGLIFSIALYLTIGPLFAIPRTATVSFVVGLESFVPKESANLWLLGFSFVFFVLVFYFSLNPAKIIDYIGKYLTPIFLIFLFVLIIVSIVKPMGEFVEPSRSYSTGSFMTGFKEGYNTMDAIASLAFGIIVINAIKNLGITDKKDIAQVTWKAGLFTTTLMALIYGLIMYMGGTSVAVIGMFDNGGQIFAAITNHYFGIYGGALLAIIIILACLKTSIGLVTSCGEFFHEVFPKVGYKIWVLILSLASFLIANIGLSNIITFAVPVLMFLYPLAIVLIILSLLGNLYSHKQSVYQVSMIFTFLISIMDGYKELIKSVPSMGFRLFDWIIEAYETYLPLYGIGLGWLLPACIGAIIGLILPNKSK